MTRLLIRAVNTIRVMPLATATISNGAVAIAVGCRLVDAPTPSRHWLWSLPVAYLAGCGLAQMVDRLGHRPGQMVPTSAGLKRNPQAPASDVTRWECADAAGSAGQSPSYSSLSTSHRQSYPVASAATALGESRTWLAAMLSIRAAAVALRAVPEEATYRGFLQARVSSRLHPGVAIVAGAVAFSLGHLGAGWKQRLSLAISGSVFGVVARYVPAGWYAAAATHTGYNVALLARRERTVTARWR